MTSSRFVFLHIGDDIDYPTLLVRSIRVSNKNCEIFQCSDTATPAITGIDHIHRIDGDISKLMTFRLRAFSELNLTGAAIYLDTDMLVVAPLDIHSLLENADVGLCMREFGRNGLINTTFKGMSMPEYEGKTFGTVYPYLACATMTRNSIFWTDCLENLLSLHEKFQFWYGDQEAIRNVANSNRYRIRRLSEAQFACLPGEIVPNIKDVAIFHFKGPTRKPYMLDYATKLNLLRTYP